MISENENMSQVKRTKAFLSELDRYAKDIEQYIYKSASISEFKPVDIEEGVIYYTTLGGKRLRPAVLMAACGAVGGDITKALPAAASVELYHTWTLIHDDIIDKDKKRRHSDSSHMNISKKAQEKYGWDNDFAKHYGVSLAMLSGDVQQGWAVSHLLPRLYWEFKIDPKIVLNLIEELDYYTLKILVEGETLDVYYSTLPIDELTQELIVDMLWKKTGVLYKYCGMAGAMIGLEKNKDNEKVKAISEFTSRCGTAFQIQDDILGIVGEEEKLGKPVGSDIREGKRTICLWKAYMNADPREKKYLDDITGNQKSTDREINDAIELIRKLNGISYAQQLSKAYIIGGVVGGYQIDGSMEYLDNIDNSSHKEFLIDWADYMINRPF
jgi:geranylgeranyl diphosphate synthase type I